MAGVLIAGNGRRLVFESDAGQHTGQYDQSRGQDQAYGEGRAGYDEQSQRRQ